jgi:hypothetical protein
LGRAVLINHCISPQIQGIMQHPTKIKAPATMIKEVKIEVIQPVRKMLHIAHKGGSRKLSHVQKFNK